MGNDTLSSMFDTIAEMTLSSESYLDSINWIGKWLDDL